MQATPRHTAPGPADRSAVVGTRHSEALSWLVGERANPFALQRGRRLTRVIGPASAPIASEAVHDRTVRFQSEGPRGRYVADPIAIGRLGSVIQWLHDPT